MKRIALLVVYTFIALYFSTGMPTSAHVFSVQIGDDDGFGGAFGADSNPGDTFDPVLLGSLADLPPGSYTNLDIVDRDTISPWTPYVFEFQFAWDTTSFASVDSATASVQTVSLGKRDAGEPATGFGIAPVTASDGISEIGLGDFSNLGTGATGSALEEIVQLQTFSVTSLIPAGTTGTLTLKIDGTSVTNPGDRFAIDFAELSIEGVAIPEPTSATIALTFIFAIFHTRRKLTHA